MNSFVFTHQNPPPWQTLTIVEDKEKETSLEDSVLVVEEKHNIE
jgi:hypothetical protein